MKKYQIILHFLLVIILLLFVQPSKAQDTTDTFSKYKHEVIDYLEEVGFLDMKEHQKWESYYNANKLKDEEDIIFEYEYHYKIGEYCDYEFYYFVDLSLSPYFIAMIDSEKNTIAFLDTLLVNQALDSITNVLKDCEQATTPKELNDFYQKIRLLYHVNEKSGIRITDSYSSPSQAIVYLLSAESALDFERAKYYMDFDRIYTSEEEWMQKVKSNPPPTDFYNYWFDIKEEGRNAVVNVSYQDRWTRYHLRKHDRPSNNWKVVRIEDLNQ